MQPDSCTFTEVPQWALLGNRRDQSRQGCAANAAPRGRPPLGMKVVIREGMKYVEPYLPQRGVMQLIERWRDAEKLTWHNLPAYRGTVRRRMRGRKARPYGFGGLSRQVVHRTHYEQRKARKAEQEVAIERYLERLGITREQWERDRHRRDDCRRS